MKTNIIIQINHLKKVYNTGSVETIALSDISFSIHKGEFVAIMGPSGSGKSTLMHILGALDLPTSGEYLLDGKNIRVLSDDEIGFIFQSYNLLPRTTAIKNVMLPMRYAGIPIDERKEKAKQYLQLVGLEDRMEHASNQLSGGQQQRVAIARALVMNPAMLLADEPTGNIASSQAAEIMSLFSQLHKQGHTIVMITHEQDIANYAKRIIHIRDGRLIDEIRKK